MIYQYEWSADGKKLTQFGQEHVARIAQGLPQVCFPVVIEPATDPHLNESRRLAVLEALANCHVPIVPDRVVLGRSEAEGLYGQEAPGVASGMLSNQGSGGGAGSMGGGATGATGGGGGHLAAEAWRLLVWLVRKSLQNRKLPAMTATGQFRFLLLAALGFVAGMGCTGMGFSPWNTASLAPSSENESTVSDNPRGNFLPKKPHGHVWLPAEELQKSGQVEQAISLYEKARKTIQA